MRKNSFLIFICSLLPGAGEMYLGMMKTGIALMSAFFGIAFFANWLNIDVLMFVLPVIWFYSFFHVHNVKMLYPETLKQMDDKAFMNFNDALQGQWPRVFEKRHAIVGGVCIFIGLAMLFEAFVKPYINTIQDTIPSLYVFVRNLPTLIVAIAVILLGVLLIKGKKDAAIPATTPDDDITEFGGKQQ